MNAGKDLSWFWWLVFGIQIVLDLCMVVTERFKKSLVALHGTISERISFFYFQLHLISMATEYPMPHERNMERILKNNYALRRASIFSTY